MLTLTLCSIYAVAVLGGVLRQTALDVDASSQTCRNVSNALFEELEEHARIVDISYCVGTYGAGIEKPFECASHCSKFKHFELVSVSSVHSEYEANVVADRSLDMEYGPDVV